MTSNVLKRIIIYISMRWQLWNLYHDNVGKSSCSEMKIEFWDLF